MKSKKCMILNPYSRTLKPATVPQNLENWKAILGTDNVGEYIFNQQGETILYSKDFFDKLTGSIAGTQFKGWKHRFYGMLIFVGATVENNDIIDLSPKAITEIQKQFEAAQVRRFKLSG